MKPIAIVRAALLSGTVLAASAVVVSIRASEDPPTERLAAASDRPEKASGRYFLVEYRNGARSESGSEDREADAARDLATWEYLVDKGGLVGAGPMIGTRKVDVNEPLSDAEHDPEQIVRVDEAEIVAGRRSVEQLTGVDLPESGEMDVLVPYSRDAAFICGLPSAVGLYARNSQGDTQSVLNNRPNLRELEIDREANRIARAWTFGHGPVVGFIWEPAEVDDVIAVATIAEEAGGQPDCSLHDVLEQVFVVAGVEP